MKHLHRWVALVAGAVTVAAGIMTAPAVFAATPTGAAAVAVACSAPAWAEGTAYAVGALVTYNGRLYRARVAHTPPVGAGWNPVAAASLWEDLGACDGTTPPTTSPTTPPTTSPTTQPPASGGLAHAPYVDMGAWPTPSLTTMVTSGNLKNVTLAFITASACKAMWFNAYDPRQAWAKDQIDAVRARGGDVKISFGGATGIELAQACTSVSALQAEYQAVVSAYALKYIDLDIEGAATADTASVTRRSQALAALQRANPGLRVSFTLPVLPEGLTADGLNVVRSARDAGVNVDLVNVMAMDYYRTGDYGDFAVQAANSTFAQVKSLYPDRTDAQVWKMVGVTPMLGANDDGHIYDQADARQLVSFAQGKHLGMLSFWELGRDKNACTGALYMCTNIPQQPYEFSKIFAGYAG
ncbi:glycosyl hydrolase family 18 protein [Actinoplanes sp. KI2]|uniref:carbohydrate-binding protein n=1 Tax=Actinoplanes sp. KI2 TaxID=2983315 RepID=UPI0021D588BF|nr:carbohydrate-binding protein [Actinoplanes sp. KI2]MCU7727876.1 glycosyl hydrolase family 18 protein [Actinoplanes sp. KI2]